MVHCFIMWIFTFLSFQDDEKMDIQSKAPWSSTTASQLPSELNERDGLVVSFTHVMYLTEWETNDQMQMETCQKYNSQ
jgi:hypothetical protein